MYVDNDKVLHLWVLYRYIKPINAKLYHYLYTLMYQNKVMIVSNSIFLVILLFYLTQWRTLAEMFTSISAIAPLLETHAKMVDDLDAIVLHEEKMLDFLKRQLKIYKMEQDMAMNDTNNYLENPINAFTLIKRLTVDKVFMKHIIKSKTDKIINELTEKHSKVIYPSVEDLKGAANALVRLKDTYQLNVSDLSKGLLNGISYGSPMRSSDCFELGRILYSLEKYEEALPWIMEAYYKLNGEDDSVLYTKKEIVEYIVYINYVLGDVEIVIEWMKTLRTIDPESTIRKTKMDDLRRAINKREIKQRNLIEGDVSEIENDASNKKNKGDADDADDADDDDDDDEYEEKQKIIFESLCRGETTVPIDISNKLRCRYFTDTHLFLKIAPFKVEQVYLNPEILIFYDVLMDEEIDEIIDTAKPNMKRAGTVGADVTDIRISKVAWISDSESEVAARVSQRVNLMTGLNLETAEKLQVVNYGIGGHYGPHYDVKTYARDLSYPGQRIVTVLFYMSDVAQGGSTVFPHLGFGVTPSKGMAVLWYNLHHSGSADLATLHGSCPVLLGSKWICTKWLYEGGQEFTRPCNLEYVPEGREDIEVENVI